MITIGIDSENNNLVLTGNLGLILSNKRLILSFKRLEFIYIDNTITIPIRENKSIQLLQEIERMLKKFFIPFQLGKSSEGQLKTYEREKEQFAVFSSNARKIRNNEFNDNAELVSCFENFKDVLARDFKRRLYDLQMLSSFHMAFSQNSCNFAVPGAGKTSIVYGAYAYLKSLPENDSRHVDYMMVIGPLSSFAPWENEYLECFGKPVNSFRMSGNAETSKVEKQQHLYSPAPAELTLIFHGGVERYKDDILDFLKRNRTMLVVDEAHKIKNHEGIWGRSVTELATEAKARIALTGTPVPNGYQDLYNLFKFIYPFNYKEILGYHYHNLVDMSKSDEIDTSRVNKLKDNLSPYFIRIKKSNLGLPPVEENVILVQMKENQREIYDFIEANYIKDFTINSNATVKDAINKAKLIRLRQAATNPSLLAKSLKDSLANSDWEYDPNAQFTTDSDVVINDSEFYEKICSYINVEIPQKFEVIYDLLKNNIILNGEKAIIWTIFIQNAKQLQVYLLKNGINAELLIGEVPQEQREITINKFNDPLNSEFQVIIANPFSVAESISLHKGCHNAIYMERDYNCSNFIQSKDRIHRVGLPKDQITRYYYLVSDSSIDNVIGQRLAMKIRRMEQIIDDDIPLFARINDNDETDIIKDLLLNYAQRT